MPDKTDIVPSGIDSAECTDFVGDVVPHQDTTDDRPEFIYLRIWQHFYDYTPFRASERHSNTDLCNHYTRKSL